MKARLLRPLPALLALATCACAAPAPGTTSTSATVANSPVTSTTLSSKAIPNSASSSTTTTSAVTDPPIVTATVGVDRPLGLKDAFDHGRWVEGSYRPAGRAEEVVGAVAHLTCGGSPSVMEYRFAQTTGKLRVTAAHDMLSPGADAVIEFRLTADGRQAQTKNLTFKESAELTVDLSGVAVVTVEAKQIRDPQKNCGKDAVALVYKMSVSAP